MIGAVISAIVDEFCRHYYCHTCKKPVTLFQDEEPQYYFYSRKRFGSMTYVVDYAFDTRKCMARYMKRSKRK